MTKRKQKYTIENAIRTIGETVQSQRSALGKTQRQLSDDSGVTQQTIVNVEKSKCPPNLEKVLQILKPLGKTLIVADIA